LPKITAAAQPAVRTAVNAVRFAVSRVHTPRQSAASAAKKSAYVRLLKRTSRMGQSRKAQKLGEKPHAETHAILPKGTPWAASRMGMAVETKPK
jgi:hypothetical protein